MTDPPAVAVRDASTVVLLRDGAAGLEAWLLTRVTQMVFAAGMTVFPGGRVDARDATLPFAGSGCVEVARRFGCDEPTARSLLGAAVREVYEETGVLLTVPAGQLPDARAEVESGRLAFAELLAEHGLAIDADGLRPWARWVTPRGEPRRYDTRFFLGGLPAGVEPMDVTTESSHAAWVGVGEALEQARRGERKMLPPTLATLSSLSGFATVADALDAASVRDLGPIRPTIRVADDGEVIADLPDGSSFTLPRTILS